MNIRQWLLFTIYRLRGQPWGKYYHQYLKEFLTGIPADTSKKLLIFLFQHCERSIPYYANIMKGFQGNYEEDPFSYLKQFPVLTKQQVRHCFGELTSTDLAKRKAYRNASGGSTGEPVELIQDYEFISRSGAITLVFSKLVGKELGEREAMLWGSILDIDKTTKSLKADLITRLGNSLFLNTVKMSPEKMREFIHILNKYKPKLIIAYAEAIYALAKFADAEHLRVIPPPAIMTSAGKLYPYMREQIEKVFQCPVFDRYGCRELGDIACEQPGFEGLWIAPWGNYIEIVDSGGNRVPDGTEGEILVTSLTNYAMPFIRYKIGDRGIILPPSPQTGRYGQVLKEVTGRSMDLFRTQDGTYINPGFLMANLYFRSWIKRYQIIQQDFLMVVYRIVKETEPPEIELKEIVTTTKKILGADCDVTFEFVEEILPSPSGKYRFLISEVC